ncbi:carboxypeptidase [Candidatus Cerribacteria bacterium 'Amazon FNV 2010 28 9']|uniref:Metal-dependent carboxypeptidase n=1 Tax=Candidatus Cerribacteria bacterium 'Amazon FNV 2010 28 9' TaxID=2081795 RepID=A0A317JM72_9BACT|nr:MAG: carboxypeptidase [Candidatus Cerribacteria bacterium 'Amazon FNV 2010 28 9']
MSVFTHSNPNIRELIELSSQLKDLSSTIALLSWDQETHLPPQGALARARQLELLSGIYHEFATKKKLGILLEKLREDIENKPQDFTQYDQALVREMSREFTMATKLPKKLVQALSKESSIGLEAWKHARAQNNFADFAPSLQKIVELKREVAHTYGFNQSPYDALLDEYEQGLTYQQVMDAFVPLRETMKVLIPQLTEKTAVYDKGILRQTFDGQQLWDFSMHVLELIGFDLERGRQDKSTHPFTMGLNIGDVRLTTRIIETNPISTLLSTIHEAGHGMYEQGISPDFADSTLGFVNSLVVHESQSRFWENMIGRSKEFWEFLYPQFQARFPKQLKGKNVEEIWRELNVIQPSLIRVDADEVTYHMHILIRTEIESALIEGKLDVKDVQSAWNEKYSRYLGISVPSDTQGCLQDIHWSQGLIGYFPTYSLGSLFSAQLYETIIQEHTDLPQAIKEGRFEKPLHWLNDKIHQHGRVYTSEQLAQKVTGKLINADAYLRYIEKKFHI